MLDCSILNTTGYNTQSESAYMLKVDTEIDYGCGAVNGKRINYKNNHSTRSIHGFIVKSWPYNNGYETVNVCEKHEFNLGPGKISNSLGCDYITQTQPCSFKVFAKFN